MVEGLLGRHNCPHCTSLLWHQDPILTLKEGRWMHRPCNVLPPWGCGITNFHLLHTMTYSRWKEMHQDKLWALLTICHSPSAEVLGNIPRKGRGISKV